uniref:MatB protein n=1 Tax=Dictyostelium discoideum TaxID=44689 RepID=D3UFE5_DICDI|nr:MatB protein [Dictyostelium discoideum]CBA34806.1 MatB protein [Dictyostelium discoideum]
MDQLDEIIEQIQKEAINSNVVLKNPRVPTQKTGELSEEQKKIVADYISEVGLNNLNATELSKRLNITVDKSKTYIKNSNRMGRTNNFKTIKMFEDDVSSASAQPNLP